MHSSVTRLLVQWGHEPVNTYPLLSSLAPSCCFQVLRGLVPWGMNWTFPGKPDSWRRKGSFGLALE